MGKPRDRSPALKKGRGARRAIPLREGLLPTTQATEEMLRDRPRRPEPFEPRTDAQARYAAAIGTQTLTFGVGPAGGGKTYVAVCKGVELFLAGEVDRMIVCRPIVEAGEELGFLPGDMMEKAGPYMTPVMDVLNRRLGRSYVEALVKAGKIEVLPLAFMRGRNLERCFVILDEAQNTTPVQMKMFLTRMAEGTRVVVDGDLSQKDIPGPSGLADALDRVSRLPGVAVVRFTKADIVRSGFVQRVVEAYSQPEEEGEGEIEAEDAGMRRALAP